MGIADWFEEHVLKEKNLRTLDPRYFALIARNCVTFMEGLIVVLKTIDYYVVKLDYRFLH